jgi:DNA-binding NarL/FixJ family response regulator
MLLEVEPTSITPREREVASYLLRGWTNPEIAQALGVSRFTVKQHVAHLIEKFGVTDRFEVARCARALGYAQAPR